MTTRNKPGKPDPTQTPAVPAGKTGVERDPMDAATYRILNRTREEVGHALEVFQHNLRGQRITERDIPRVTVPPQGMTIWTIPTAEGDAHVEELTGILVDYTLPRALFGKPLESGGVAPPVCSSPDGIKGIGSPGGDCYGCPFNQFGSDPREESNGKACKEKRMLYLLRPDSILPLVVQAPSTSIPNVFRYVTQLGNEETKFETVFTRITLEKVNAGALSYSKVVLRNMGAIPEEYYPHLEQYQQGLRRILSAQQIDVTADVDNPAPEVVEGDTAPADPE